MSDEFQIDMKSFEALMASHQDLPLHDSIKLFIQDRINDLQSEYDKIITNPKCTEADALEYITLFNVFGNWIAAILGCTMDEYYMATDVVIDIVGLSADSKNPKEEDNEA